MSNQNEKFQFILDTTEPICDQIEHMYHSLYISRCILVCNDMSTANDLSAQLTSMDHCVVTVDEFGIADALLKLYNGSTRFLIVPRQLLLELDLIRYIVSYVFDTNDLFITYDLDPMVEDRILRDLSEEMDNRPEIKLYYSNISA